MGGLRGQDRTFLKDGGGDALLHILQREGDCTALQFDPPAHVRDICFWLQPEIATDAATCFDPLFADLVRQVCSSAGVDTADTELFDEGYVDAATGRIARGYHIKMSASHTAFSKSLANSLVEKVRES